MGETCNTEISIVQDLYIVCVKYSTRRQTANIKPTNISIGLGANGT